MLIQQNPAVSLDSSLFSQASESAAKQTISPCLPQIYCPNSPLQVGHAEQHESTSNCSLLIAPFVQIVSRLLQTIESLVGMMFQTRADTQAETATAETPEKGSTLERILGLGQDILEIGAAGISIFGGAPKKVGSLFKAIKSIF